MNFKQFMRDDSLKNRKLKELFCFIQQQGPVKKVDLLKLTKYKKTTLVRLVDELLQYGFIFESGIEQSSGGRPPILYEVTPTANYVVGVDISRTHTKIGLLNMKFTVVDQKSFDMSDVHTPERVIHDIVECVQLFKARHQLSEEDILGIGVGAVGPVNRTDGIILTPESFNAVGWNNIEIVKELEERLSLATVLENGANSAALGEFYKSGSKEENLLYCINGMGLRCGILMNGQLIKNNKGDASSFGHMMIDLNGKDCVCGKKGCLLPYISFPSIVQEVKRRIVEGEVSSVTEMIDGEIKSVSIEHILEASKQNDQLANQVILTSAYYYGIGLANIINILHPDQVLLNGRLILEHPTYFEEVIKAAKNHMYIQKDDHYFSKGSLKENAVIIGAAIHRFQTF